MKLIQIRNQLIFSFTETTYSYSNLLKTYQKMYKFWLVYGSSLVILIPRFRWNWSVPHFKITWYLRCAAPCRRNCPVDRKGRRWSSVLGPNLGPKRLRAALRCCKLRTALTGSGFAVRLRLDGTLSITRFRCQCLPYLGQRIQRSTYLGHFE